MFSKAKMALAAALLAVPLSAASADDKADIAQAEDYLNTVQTLKARFVQVAPSGETAEGDLFLSRPGRMRLEYDPPAPILVLATGKFLIYYDKKMKQTSYMDLDTSIAGVLVRDKVKLDGQDLKVLKVTHAPDLLNITVTHRKDPSQGQITLVFTQHPFALRQWQVLDAQNQATTVSLFEPKLGIPLDPELFKFHDPNAQIGPDLSTKGQ